MASGLKERIIERRKLALELRQAGMVYREIAKVLQLKGFDCSLSSVYRDIKCALAELNKKSEELILEIRTLELSRLDALNKVLWAKALKGDLSVIDRVLKIQERRTKILGLDAPTKIVSKHEFVEKNIPYITTLSNEQDKLEAVRIKMEEIERKILEDSEKKISPEVERKVDGPFETTIDKNIKTKE